MRRTTVLALRTARRTAYRTALGYRSCRTSLASQGLGCRYLSSSRQDRAGTPSPRSMYFRNFSVALISSIAGFGAWYAYRDGSAPSTASRRDQSAAFSSSAGSTGKLTAANVYSTSPQAAPSLASAEEATESTRRALVVDNDQFYTGVVVGDQPLEKATDDAGRKIVEMMTPEQATQKLRRNEESYLVGRGRGVVRYDVVQIPSNDPIEDDHAEKIVEIPQTVAATEDGTSSSDWMFWGVFDGHSGWTTSAKLRQVLISFVARELNATYKAALSDPTITLPAPEAIDTAIKKGFIRLDHEIVHESVEKAMKASSKRVVPELLGPAVSGSCALLSFYDSHSKMLRVACTGDSRAVLGRRSSSGKWAATPLSVDQTGGNEQEAARIRSEHPGENGVIRDGRVLGRLEPTRAFGDAIYKWSRETQQQLKKSFFGRTPPDNLRSPPYVTAEPVVTSTKVDPEKGDFLVMATDGLWEMLTNEEVIGLVGQWLDTQASSASSTGSAKSNSWLKSWFGTQQPLPVEKNEADKVDARGQRAPIRQRQWGFESNEDSRFVVDDKNAATHVVRNALGGKNRDMVCALLTLPSPWARRWRDDLTVEVIFFGEGNESGNVVPNTEASAPEKPLKAKL
ncbi:MAG: hypothetical protein M1833_002812 [Piccolia ochrophora]|nr:MAG: hypothetical protein M1833_002812 [Piccolia ochrophora]